MTLSAGTRLGAYEILEPIGAGGMGEVYRARDTRLDRQVALKTLPLEMSGDSMLRVRFQREAKIISQLEHPNICRLYDVGESDLHPYLVMELLDGETLSQRIGRGPMPLEQILKIGIEIASALEAANRRGLVHRDLKPGNVMMTGSGAKLLDFGLARMVNPVLGGDNVTNLPTARQPITADGAIVGTLQYMAPEQLEGKEADHRTDIFALGLVLYEMTSGRRPFGASSKAGLIASVLEHQPPSLSAARPDIPPELDRVIQACLEKNPDDRLQTAHDLRLQLQWIADAERSRGSEERAVRTAATKTWIPLAVAVLMTVAAFALAALLLRERSREEPRTALSMIAPPGTQLQPWLALSPDGEKLAFVARDEKAIAFVDKESGGIPAIWVRDLGSINARKLSGTEGAAWVFWSPDSKWIGYSLYRTGTIYKIAADGSAPPELIVKSGTGAGAAWAPDGTILYSPRWNEGLFRVPSSGGEPVRVTTLNRGRKESLHGWPAFLSDGRRFLFLNHTTGEEPNQIYASSLDDPALHPVLKADALVGYAAPDLYFVKNTALFAIRFDEKTLRPEGEPLLLADGVRFMEDYTQAAASVSAGRSLAWMPAVPTPVTLRQLDLSGKVTGIVPMDDDATRIDVERHSGNIAFSRKDLGKGAKDIWWEDRTRGIRTRLTGGLSDHDLPVWSPDGRTVAYQSERAGMYDLYLQPADGSAPERPLLVSPRDKYPSDWSPDGRFLIGNGDDPVNGRDLLLFPLDGGPAVTFLQTPADEWDPQFSPDGRRVAFVSTRSGESQIYVKEFPAGAVTQVSADGGTVARWGRGGDRLFFISPEKHLMSASIAQRGTSVVVSPAQDLFPLPDGGVGLRDYDVDADGQHFLYLAASPRGLADQSINVMTGWRKRLKTRD